MKEKLSVLIDLQAIETEMAQVQNALGKIPAAIEALDSHFFDLRSRLSESTGVLGEMKKDYRAKESDVQMNTSRIKKSRERMDAVKTNKEYQSILKEIQDMEEKNSLIEDDMIASLDRIEEGEKVVQRLKEEMKVMEKKVEEEKSVINRRAGDLEQRKSELEKLLAEKVQYVDAEIFKTYQKVKLRVGHIGIVPVTNAVCKGCHLTIPPQMYNELHRQDSLKFCPHCHRMIYWASDESKPVGVD